MRPQWYLAILVVASRIDGREDGEPLLELQHKLIRAVGPEAAYRRALELGVSGDHDYETSGGERVSWQFVGLHDLCMIHAPRLRDGVEVYSRMERLGNREVVRPKAMLQVFWCETNNHRTAAELLDS